VVVGGGREVGREGDVHGGLYDCFLFLTFLYIFRVGCFFFL
jgi:hypothetical protein